MTTAISKQWLIEESELQLRSIIASLVAYINPILEAHFFPGATVTVDEAPLIKEVLQAPMTQTVRQALIDEYTSKEAGWNVEYVCERDGNFFLFC